MKIGVACGGTGGHIFPGLATARVLRERGHEVILWLAGKAGEDSALKGWNGPVVTVYSQGLSTSFSLRNLGALWRMFRAVIRCLKSMRQYRPVALLAMGSYASIGPVLAARLLGIPVVLHEANVIPGRANRFLSRWVAAVAVGFEETRRYLVHPRIIYTGMPLYRRPRIEEVTTSDSCDFAAPLVARARESGRDRLIWGKLRDDVFTVLVMGGSRGARRLNERASAAILALHQQGTPIQVIHLTGPADESAIHQAYRKAGVCHAVFGFLHAMDEAYQRSNLAICRSGASTCAELSAHGLAALLVPYPFAIHQHQMANAKAMEKAGAADVLAESELTADGLAEYIRRQMQNLPRLQAMAEASRRRIVGDPTALLADRVLAIAGNERVSTASSRVDRPGG